LKPDRDPLSILAANPARSARVRAALYARVSTRQEGRQSVENQLRELRAYARRMRWTVAAEYSDRISGATEKRPALDKLMQAATGRTFDVVLVWDLSRLTRGGPASAFRYMDRLKAAGVELWSYREEHFRTAGPVGAFLIAVAAFLAEQERAVISGRVKAGLDRAKAAGRVLGRKPRVVDIARLTQLRDAGHSIRDCARILKTSRSVIERRLT